MPLLTVKDLTISAQKQRLVGPLSLTLDHGERRALLGPSGSGKSLTTAAILGTITPTLNLNGSIRINGNEVLGIPFPRRAHGGTKLAFVHQDPTRALNAQTTIGSHLAVALGATSPRAPQVLDLLESLAFTDAERIARSLPHELSGGQRQRVCLGIALATRPDLLVADEPTTALDSVTQAEVLALIDSQLPRRCALLFITHDLAAVKAVNAAAWEISEGTICESAANREEQANNLRNGTAKVELRADASPTTTATPDEGAAGDASRSAEASHGEDLTGSSLRGAAKSGACMRDRVASAPENPTLRALGVSVEYRKRARLFQRAEKFNALTDVNCDVQAGMRLGIVGSSGSGKSTLIAALLGLKKVSAGTVEFEGADVSRLSAEQRKRFRRAVQYVPQDARGSLNPLASVLNQVTEPLRFLGETRNARSAQSAHWQRERAAEVLSALHIDSSLWGKKPHQISGGQAQRVAIARALATDPQFLIADEPLTGLDPALRAQIEGELRGILLRRPGMGFVMVSHDLDSVLSLCTDIAVMHEGRIDQRIQSTCIADAAKNGEHSQLIGRALRALLDAHMSTGGHAHSLEATK